MKLRVECSSCNATFELKSLCVHAPAAVIYCPYCGDYIADDEWEEITNE